MMNREERKKVLETLDMLYTSWENEFECIIQQMDQESIEQDFFEDLYEILYEFNYNEKKLLARVWKLLDQKTMETQIKTNKTGIIKNSLT